MKQFKRLFYYLLINILVSACTILVILFLWERTHPFSSGASLFPFLSSQPEISAPLPTSIPTAESLPATSGPDASTSQPTLGSLAPTTTLSPSTQVMITNVFGLEDLSTERVHLVRKGDGDLPLNGWSLSDGNGHTYTFPSLTLFPEGAIDLYTQAGANNVTALYWGLDQPVWKSGETVTLKDALGNVRASYTIP